MVLGREGAGRAFGGNPSRHVRGHSTDSAGFAGASVPALTIKIADRLCNVRDFLVTHPGYAQEYSLKADALFTAMKARLEEVAGRFDEETERRMVSDCEELCAELGV